MSHGHDEKHKMKANPMIPVFGKEGVYARDR